jgi:hypothetical protein
LKPAANFCSASALEISNSLQYFFGLCIEDQRKIAVILIGPLSALESSCFSAWVLRNEM